MYYFKSSKIKKALILALSVWIAICAILINHYSLNITPSITLFLAGIGVFVLLNPLLIPILKHHQKKINTKNKIIEKHISIAKNHGKKMYGFGEKNALNEKKHTIWGTNKLRADKIYNYHFKEAIKNDPKTEFFYISAVCHNIPNLNGK